MGDNIKTAIEGLLTSWFFGRYRGIPTGDTPILQSFLRVPNDFGVSTVPMHTLKTVAASHTKIGLKSFIETNIVLHQRYRWSMQKLRATRLFNEWRSLEAQLCPTNFKGVNYFLGPGMLLSAKFKPLIMATCSVVTFKRKGVIKWYAHSPTVNIAPELMSDSTWKKIILNYFIPLCNQPIKIKNFSSSVPETYKNTQQTINLQIHDLSQFIISIKIPELTENLTEELGTEMQSFTELPQLI